MVKYQMQAGQHPKPRHKKHNQIPQYKNLTPFKAMEKHFKLYQHQQTDFSIVYEPKQYHNVDGYQIAELPFPEGSVIVRNFNTPETVHEIVAHALNVYCKKPYRTNLDSREEMYQEETVKKEQKEEGNEPVKQEQKKEEIKEQQEKKGYFFNDKIRWSNVGYQYDWTERKYPKMKTQFPQNISSLCERANNLFNLIRSQKKQYYPQSAIINYYGQKDYMTGHLDDAQIDQTSPIYSFSFGLSCIFLIGTNTKDVKPVAVRLNSGDLFIMSGQSRLAYHGVPRIIAGSYHPPQGLKPLQTQKQWQNTDKQVTTYILKHRLNINVRQVYPQQ